MARLRRIGPEGAPEGESWDLGPGLIIGRGDECGAVLADPQVSRAHARIEPVAGGFDLLDLNSANGTFVADRRVSRHRLHAGELFRVGGTWFAVEGATAPPHTPSPPIPSWSSPPLPASDVAGPQQQSRRPRGSSGWLWGLGCLSLGGLSVLLVGAVAGVVWWRSVQPLPQRNPVGPDGQAPAAAPAPTTLAGGEAALTLASVPMEEADVLHFTLKLATNPVLDGCAAMPAAWTPPSLELPLSTRVGSDGSFRIEQGATDAAGQHRVVAEGRWADETLELRGRWTTLLSRDGDEQRDEGSFEAGGQRLAGTWFGDRLTGGVESSFRGASCREGIDNGYSRVNALEW